MKITLSMTLDTNNSEDKELFDDIMDEFDDREIEDTPLFPYHGHSGTAGVWPGEEDEDDDWGDDLDEYEGDLY